MRRQTQSAVDSFDEYLANNPVGSVKPRYHRLIELDKKRVLESAGLSDATLDSVLRGLQQAAERGFVDGPDLTEEEDDE